ncbi:MAG: 5-formyltetrahydrofolate cyclo-ligase [Pseudomonadota bacterium]
MTDTDAAKAAARARYKALRSDARRAWTDSSAPEVAMARHLSDARILAPDAIVGCYMPIGDEIDPIRILTAAASELQSTAEPESTAAPGSTAEPKSTAVEPTSGDRAQLITALPVMRGRGQPLDFHSWQRGDPLETVQWGIREPTASAPSVRPSVLLVPLLAVDAQGYRLGYGGGFYDRTLGGLRRDGGPPIIAVGLAFDQQCVDALPRDAYDAPVDALLTPKRFTWLTHRADASA